MLTISPWSPSRHRILRPPLRVDPRWATQGASSHRFPGESLTAVETPMDDMRDMSPDAVSRYIMISHDISRLACKVQWRLEAEKLQETSWCWWCWVVSANDQRLPMADSKQGATEFASCQSWSLKSLQNVRTEEESNRTFTWPKLRVKC